MLFNGNHERMVGLVIFCVLVVFGTFLMTVISDKEIPGYYEKLAEKQQHPVDEAPASFYIGDEDITYQCTRRHRECGGKNVFFSEEGQDFITYSCCTAPDVEYNF